MLVSCACVLFVSHHAVPCVLVCSVATPQIGSKTTKDIVEFYYHWKKSSHYQLWRYHRTELTESNLTVAMQTALLKKNRAALAKAKLDTE